MTTEQRQGQGGEVPTVPGESAAAERIPGVSASTDEPVQPHEVATDEAAGVGAAVSPAPADAALDVDASAPDGEPSEPGGEPSEPGGEPGGEEEGAELVEGEEVAGAEGQSAVVGEEGAKKKRRRRRRRRKPDAAAGAPAEGEVAAEAADENAAGPEEEGSDAEAGPGNQGKSRRKHDRERPAFHLGEEVLCRVTTVTEQAIWADIAGKAIGVLDRSAHSGPAPEVGTSFVSKVQSASARGGIVLLAYEPLKPTEARQRLREIVEKKETVEGWVTGVIKGGVEVDLLGVRCFAPASHVDLHHRHDLSPLVGQKLEFEVTHYGQKGRDVVVSRKRFLEKDAKEERERVLSQIAPDLVTRGVVRNVLHWGAFVALPDYGNVEGVVHMSEASHDRGAKLTEVLKPGDQIQVKVLRIDDKGKLWLSHKAVLEDPWQAVRDKYRPGSRHTGKVARITDFGAFVQLEPGVDGLCHVADIAYFPVDHPSKVVKIGDDFEAVVAHLDPESRKLTLHAAPPADEAGEAPVRVQPYQIVQAVVVQVKESGLGMRIVGASGRAARAFLPAGQTGTPRGTDLRKLFPPGKRLEAKVIEADPRKGETRLSIKALKEDAEKAAYREYRKEVQREAKFGTFADLFKAAKIDRS